MTNTRMAKKYNIEPGSALRLSGPWSYKQWRK